MHPDTRDANSPGGVCAAARLSPAILVPHFPTLTSLPTTSFSSAYIINFSFPQPILHATRPGKTRIFKVPAGPHSMSQTDWARLTDIPDHRATVRPPENDNNACPAPAGLPSTTRLPSFFAG